MIKSNFVLTLYIFLKVHMHTAIKKFYYVCHFIQTFTYKSDESVKKGNDNGNKGRKRFLLFHAKYAIFGITSGKKYHEDEIFL